MNPFAQKYAEKNAEKTVNHGFKPSELADDHFVLGSGKMSEKYGAVELMPGGHGWGQYVPDEEYQNRNGFETMACTVFATLKALGTLAHFQGFKDFPENSSERYGAVMAGVSPSGADPHKVIDTFRNLSGVIPNGALPWTTQRTWNDFYAPKPMLASFIAMGQIIIRNFDIGHEWVFSGKDSNKPAKLKAALSRGTVCASVHAWKEKDGFYFKDTDDIDNHWIQIVDYEDGKYWEISDQYLPFRKKLSWDYDFYQSKWYALKRKENTTNADFSAVLSLMIYNLKTMLSILVKRLGLWNGS